MLNGAPVRANFDSNDHSGVHVNKTGAEKIMNQISLFIDSDIILPFSSSFNTPISRKRFRSNASIPTPPEDRQMSKSSRHESEHSET